MTKTQTLKRRSVSAIVPVFDEEKTVAGVVEVFLKSPLIDEVIAVNDGSTDRSLEILKEFGNRIGLINLKKNRGKGFALASGVKKAKGEIVTFSDADLTKLSAEHVETLLHPIITGKVRAVVGFRALEYLPNTIPKTLSGQRAYYKKDLLPHLKKIADARFGVEVYLNSAFKNETLRVPLKGISSLYKHEKYNPQKAFKEYLKEAVEVTRTIAKREDLLQADIQILDRISQAANLDELRNRVNKVRNRRIKQLLNDYLLRYIR